MRRSCSKSRPISTSMPRIEPSYQSSSCCDVVVRIETGLDRPRRVVGKPPAAHEGILDQLDDLGDVLAVMLSIRVGVRPFRVVRRVRLIRGDVDRRRAGRRKTAPRDVVRASRASRSTYSRRGLRRERRALRPTASALVQLFEALMQIRVLAGERDRRERQRRVARGAIRLPRSSSRTTAADRSAVPRRAWSDTGPSGSTALETFVQLAFAIAWLKTHAFLGHCVRCGAVSRE